MPPKSFMQPKGGPLIKFKPIVPKKTFDINGFYDAIQREAEIVGRSMEADFLRTVETWVHQVFFHTDGGWGGSYFTYTVYAEDQIYFWVNEGTKAHPIAARNVPMLRYQANFDPKTSPGVLSSQMGGKWGPWVSWPRVMHPGFQARKFDEAVAKKSKKLLEAGIKKAMKEGARASGHYFP